MHASRNFACSRHLAPAAVSSYPTSYIKTGLHRHGMPTPGAVLYPGVGFKLALAAFPPAVSDDDRSCRKSFDKFLPNKKPCTRESFDIAEVLHRYTETCFSYKKTSLTRPTTEESQRRFNTPFHKRRSSRWYFYYRECAIVGGTLHFEKQT